MLSRFLDESAADAKTIYAESTIAVEDDEDSNSYRARDNFRTERPCQDINDRRLQVIARPGIMPDLLIGIDFGMISTSETLF